MNRAAIEAFLAEPRVMLLTANRNGKEPFVAPVWYEYRDGRVFIWVGAEEAKCRLVRRNPAVTLCVQTEAFPYKVVLIRGAAEVRPGFDEALVRRITVRYLGETFADTFIGFYTSGSEDHMATMVVTPSTWRAWDYREGLSADTVSWTPDGELR